MKVNFWSNRSEKTEIYTHKSVFIQLNCEFFYDYVKPKYEGKKQNCVILIQKVSLYT